VERPLQGVAFSDPLTGHRLEPTTGVTPSTPVEIRADQLPIRLMFQGRRYILRKTSNGKLIMTGDFR
jgi:hypothetical protein